MNSESQPSSRLLAQAAAATLGFVLANDEHATEMLSVLCKYMDKQAKEIERLEKEVDGLYEDAAGEDI